MKRVSRAFAALTAATLLLVATPAFAANDELVIEGSGWGHGIGMSQYGSYGRALDGQKYKDILAAYYTGTSIGVIGEGSIPILETVMTNVRSDDDTVTVSIIDGPGTGSSVVTVTRSSGETVDMSPGDTLTVVDTDTGANGGCTASFTLASGDIDWDNGSCDLEIGLAASDTAPDNLVQLDECRTTNCTFAWGEKLLLVDNASDLRTKDDRVGGAPYGELYPGFDIVVEATLDDYTRGIAESKFSWGDTSAGMNALYTQAVAARSYAASFVAAVNPAAAGCFCDVKNNSSYQVYAGWLGDVAGEPEPLFKKWQNWDAAAVATAGEIVSHPDADSDIVRAYYSSSNGGASENKEDIWGGSTILWLQSVDDPLSTSVSSGNPYASWSEVRSTSILESKLNLDNVYDVRIAETYDSGTPSRIVVTGERNGKTVEVDDYPVGSGNHMDGVLFDSWYGLRGPHITGFGGALPEQPPVTDVDRWWGADRYATAVEVSWANFPYTADAVVVATGLNYPDALAAASFAAQIDAPVLLVKGGEVPDVTLKEVKRLKPSKVYILGGSTAVPDSAEHVLDDIAPVTRLAGANRYGTAIEISKIAHPGTVDAVYLAPGTSFVEALVAGPAAASSGNAILLTPPTKLDGAVAAEIRRLSPSKIVVIGGGTVISQSVVDQLASYAGTVISIAGGDRYATSALVSQQGFPDGADTVLIATGALFADALSGSGVAGDLHAPVLLVSPTSLPSVVADELVHLNPSTVRVLGGSTAIADSVVQAIIDLLK